ncbi:hydantoinase B/oxoprolinase family protein [Nocardioides sp.]|uniref:hydantoinase B/oxoprolinase family protein n=1 Tax=Nocardioides sp. TaxID=35761 RepID=UPI0039E44DC5
MTETVDAVDIAVIRGYLESAANEMELTLCKTAEGTMINQALDATAAIFDREGNTIAQAEALPCHLGMLVDAVASIISTFPADEATPGDVYLLNDPYSGGTHLPDFAVVEPVFADGKVITYTATMAHHTDIGGTAPGSTAPTAMDIHAEGIRFPPLKIVEAGVLDAKLMLLFQYNSRNGSALCGDIEAQIAACHVGRRRMEEAYARWGATKVTAVADELMNIAERITREAIRSIPDGSYSFTDYLDDDGIVDQPIPITVTVTVTGSDIDFDFTGTGAQCAGAINCTPSSSISGVYFGVRVLCPESMPSNAGCFRSVTVNLPAGTMVNANYPSPVGARAVTFKRVATAVQGALAMAAPDRVGPAGDGQASLLYINGPHGVEPMGLPHCGGFGARPNKDGLDMTDTDLANASGIPVEITESRLPVIYDHLRLWTDSGGAGEFRGGLGCHGRLRWLGDDAIFSTRRDRHVFAPWGAGGGDAAPVSRYQVTRANGEVEELPSKGVHGLGHGDVLEMWTSGGGGLGSPLRREPSRVLQDIVARRVSPDRARDVYGVVVDDDGVVDEEATRQLRRDLAAAKEA